MNWDTLFQTNICWHKYKEDEKENYIFEWIQTEIRIDIVS